MCHVTCGLGCGWTKEVFLTGDEVWKGETYTLKPLNHEELRRLATILETDEGEDSIKMRPAVAALLGRLAYRGQQPPGPGPMTREDWDDALEAAECHSTASGRTNLDQLWQRLIADIGRVLEQAKAEVDRK